MVCNVHNRLLMQFHITGMCNLQCKHCYREDGNVQPLSYDDVIKVLEQYKELLEKYNRIHSIKRKGHVNITGGEPLIRNDIKDIFGYLGANNQFYTYGILSNGSFINDEVVELLKQTDVSFVQLSIDGDRCTHDALRAPGDYDRVFSAAAFLEKNKIRTYISFTANKANYKHLPAVARECRKRKITKLWSDRIVPIGNGEDLKEFEITSDILPDYLKMLKKAQGNPITGLLHKHTTVTMNRALQFLDGNGEIYSCSAADSLITVDEFGNIMPCRRMPIICGNVFENTLESVYFENEVFRNLRIKAVPRACSSCVYSYLCRGGAKCQSYARFGNYNCKDSACPLV